MDDARDVNIHIHETFSFDKESKLLLIFGIIFGIFFILAFFMLFAYYYDSRPYYSPPDDIFTFFETIDENYGINFVLGDKANENEINEIESFLYFRTSNFSIGSEIRDNSIIVGTKKSFSGFDSFPYSKFLGENNAVVIFESKTNSVYIYAKDSNSLKNTLMLLNENIGMFGYSAVKINGDSVEELIVE